MTSPQWSHWTQCRALLDDTASKSDWVTKTAVTGECINLCKIMSKTIVSIIETIMNTNNCGGRKWKCKFDHQGRVQKLPRTNETTRKLCHTLTGMHTKNDKPCYWPLFFAWRGSYIIPIKLFIAKRRHKAHRQYVLYKHGIFNTAQRIPIVCKRHLWADLPMDITIERILSRAQT